MTIKNHDAKNTKALWKGEPPIAKEPLFLKRTI